MKTKAVLYLRFSDTKQNESSITGQRNVCMSFCEREGLEIVGEYIDRAHSAFTHIEKRKEFLRMIKDSAKGKFQAVVVYKLDRFSRQKFECALYEMKLSNNNVQLLSACEPNENSAESRLMRSQFQAWSQYYSEELSQKVKRGLRVSEAEHRFLGGYVPIGYKIINKKYVVDPDSSKIVIEIFNRVISNEPLTEIADDLNKRGIKTQANNKWNRGSFHALLSNKKYIGIYNATQDGVPFEEADESLRIIDNDTFYKVQSKLANNEHTKKRESKHYYLLTNKLYCSCDSKFYGESAKGKSQQYFYYYTCPVCKKRLREEKINNDILDGIKSIVDDELINSLSTSLYNAMVQEDDVERINALKREKAQKEKIYRTLLENLSEMDAWDDISKSLLSEKKQEIELLNQEIATSTTTKFTLDEIKEFYREMLMNKEKEYDNALLNSLVSKIVINENNDYDIYLYSIASSSRKILWRTESINTRNYYFNLYY